MTCLNNIQIQNVIEPDYIFFFQDADIAINIQVLQVLLPHIEADDTDDISEDLLERCTLPIVLICSVECALDND